MNLQDFNNDFTVKVVYFDDTTSNVAVHFSVKCLVDFVYIKAGISLIVPFILS